MVGHIFFWGGGGEQGPADAVAQFEADAATLCFSGRRRGGAGADDGTRLRPLRLAVPARDVPAPRDAARRAAQLFALLLLALPDQVGTVRALDEKPTRRLIDDDFAWTQRVDGHVDVAGRLRAASGRRADPVVALPSRRRPGAGPLPPHLRLCHL